MFHLAAEVCVFFLLQNKRVFSRNLPLIFCFVGCVFRRPAKKISSTPIQSSTAVSLLFDLRERVRETERETE